MSEPWICPRCQQSNAPWIPCCSCKVHYVGASRAPVVTNTPWKPSCPLCNGSMDYACGTCQYFHEIDAHQ
jgi:hypothetical protein